MSRSIEVRESLDERAIEKITLRANEISKSNRLAYVERAMRIVRDRNPAVMLILEKGAEAMAAVNENQHGQTQRQSRHRGTALGVQATDASLWQNAYRLADEGRPLEHFGWLYVAVCEHAGFAF